MTVAEAPVGIDHSASRKAVDFDVVGTPLDEWLGKTSHPNVLKAAEKALVIPGEKIMVCVIHDGTVVDAQKWAGNERRALARWFASNHSDRSGRVRLTAQTHLEPSTLQNVKVVSVVYEPNWKPKVKR